MTRARERSVYETRVRRHLGRVMAWGVWRVTAPRSPRVPPISPPEAVAEFYGNDAQGRATQYANQLTKEEK